MASPGFPAAGPGLGVAPRAGVCGGPSPPAAASFASFAFGVLFKKNKALRTRFIPVKNPKTNSAFCLELLLTAKGLSVFETHLARFTVCITTLIVFSEMVICFIYYFRCL